MALLDLSLITEALITLIDEGIKQSHGWSGSGPTVTGLPPDELEGNNAVGMYLYHVTEEAAHKNQVWPARPASPIRYSPMGLNLHYLLSTHAEFATEKNRIPLREQLLFGLAMKALHDYPIVDDFTQIGPVVILPDNLRAQDNRIRIQARPVPPNEAVSYWTAGSKPLRLSGYYEVSVVLLEPEHPATGGGRVLTRRISVFTGSLPRLTATRSVVSFTIPGESEPREVEAQPAQVAYGDELILLGENLIGDRVTLLVRAPGWSAPVEADPSWGGVAAGDRFYATARSTIDGRAVLPGTHEASLRVTSGGLDKTTSSAFLVTPTVVVPATIPTTGTFSITGGTFEHADLPEGTVRVIVGETDLQPLVPPAVLGPGKFEIIDGARIDAQAPAGLIPGEHVPVRVVVNGAESAPRWAEVT